MAKWLALLAGVTLSSVSLAGVDPATPPKEVAAKFGLMMKIEGWFKGPGNLLGAAARLNNQPLVFFTDPEGRYMVSGVAIDTMTGKNITMEATAQFFGKEAAGDNKAAQGSVLPNPAKLNMPKEDLMQLKGITQGNPAAKAKAYIIFDFACSHCMNAYAALSKESLSGQIVWVPVSFSGEVATSKSALAAGLGKMDAVVGLSGKELRAFMLANKTALAKGALIVENNTSLAEKNEITSTPFFIYERNGTWYSHEGYASAQGLANALGVK